jgi:hypothetical protein
VIAWCAGWFGGRRGECLLKCVVVVCEERERRGRSARLLFRGRRRRRRAAALAGGAVRARAVPLEGGERARRTVAKRTRSKALSREIRSITTRPKKKHWGEEDKEKEEEA